MAMMSAKREPPPPLARAHQVLSASRPSGDGLAGQQSREGVVVAVEAANARIQEYTRWWIW